MTAELSKTDATWMEDVDRKVLYVLESELELTPVVIARNTGVDLDVVETSLEDLQSAGFVEYTSFGFYKIPDDLMKMWKEIDDDEL